MDRAYRSQLAYLFESCARSLRYSVVEMYFCFIRLSSLVWGWISQWYVVFLEAPESCRCINLSSNAPHIAYWGPATSVKRPFNMFCGNTRGFQIKTCHQCPLIGLDNGMTPINRVCGFAPSCLALRGEEVALQGKGCWGQLETLSVGSQIIIVFSASRAQVSDRRVRIACFAFATFDFSFPTPSWLGSMTGSPSGQQILLRIHVVGLLKLLSFTRGVAKMILSHIYIYAKDGTTNLTRCIRIFGDCWMINRD